MTRRSRSEEQNEIRSDWNLLWSLGALFTSVLAGFLQPPPPPSYGSPDEGITRIAQFAVTIVAGLVLVFGTRFRRKKDMIRWAIVSGLCLLIAIGLYITYMQLIDSYTAQYNAARIVIGPQDALQSRYEDGLPGSIEEVILDHAGNVYEIWDRHSIEERRTRLRCLFLLTLPFFTVSMVSLVLARQCYRS